MIDSSFLEKLIVLIVTFHFMTTFNPIGDKVNIYASLIKKMFGSSINFDNVATIIQIYNLSPNLTHQSVGVQVMMMSCFVFRASNP